MARGFGLYVFQLQASSLSHVDSPRVEQGCLPGPHLARGLLPAAIPFQELWWKG